jgi:hypothetical protein
MQSSPVIRRSMRQFIIFHMVNERETCQMMVMGTALDLVPNTCLGLEKKDRLYYSAKVPYLKPYLKSTETRWIFSTHTHKPIQTHMCTLARGDPNSLLPGIYFSAIIGCLSFKQAHTTAGTSKRCFS